MEVGVEVGEPRVEVGLMVAVKDGVGLATGRGVFVGENVGEDVKTGDEVGVGD